MTTPAATAAAPKGRLGNGQLRRQVAQYLADNPGPRKTGEIAKALGRSAGAVGNALTTLAGRGEADLVPGKQSATRRTAMGMDEVWFIRYRNREETDHLRVRVGAGHGQAQHRAAALAAWASDLRSRRLCARAALDTYYPEAGRYGSGQAMRAAEAVFAADSAVVIAQLRQPPGTDPVTLTALGMLDIAAAFSGGPDQGARWLAGRRLQPGKTADHATARTASTLARTGEMSSFGTLPDDLAPAWLRRAEAVAAYRETLDADTDFTHVLESLLHIHHNRYRGIDRDGEGACRRLARQAALARRAARLPETA